MAFSSVSVVMSSLTLKWWTRPVDSVMPDEVAADSGAGWTGMFLDSTATVLDSARIMLFSGRRTEDEYRYSQLPVEMDQRGSAAV